VRQFLKEHIRSLEQLEILLLLQKDAQREWSPAEVYRVVRSSERSVTETLETLGRQGLLRKTELPAESKFQFSPSTDLLRTTIGNLADLYSERRVRIVEAIYSERISPMDEFAKAFRLRKDGNG
jgi:hypothetical protein